MYCDFKNLFHKSKIRASPPLSPVRL